MTLPAQMEIISQQDWTLAALMGALESAATAHANALHIGHERVLGEFGCLWMLARSRLCMKRLPAQQEPLTIRTWLRAPSAATSVRDYDIYSGDTCIGSAVHRWVLVKERERKIADLRKIAPLWELPTLSPERTDMPGRLHLPEQMQDAHKITIAQQTIDENGHMNNVAYVRLALPFVPASCKGLEILFGQECFAGETLQIRTAQENDAYFVCGVKESGAESFRMRFYE
ncbi:MAG: hypothetical protein LBM28_03400 [Oscillospiraceae bacterium]|nr:hypothetical protein [Oscillospiraceae bacterium]